MVSALRERATRQSTAASSAAGARPPVVDDEVEFTTPLRAHRPRRVVRRRWLDGRRFGLGVSIAAGMLASAIGGALLAYRSPAPIVVAAAAPAASAPHAAASSAAMAVEAASAVAHPAVVAAASAAASAPAETHAGAPAASAVHADAGATAAPPAADLTFGLDINGDGIPDSLERFVRKTMPAPATRVAARRYYRLALGLATRAQQGEVLPHAEKQGLFRAAECYWLSAAEDGIANPPNLNDRASLIGVAAADRMQALNEALQGFDYRVGSGKRSACG